MQAENPVPQPVRQAPAALWFILGTFIRRILRQAWPLLLIAYFRPSGDNRAIFILVVVLAVAITALVLSLINYFRFFYWVENGSLIIEQGVIKRSRVAIPFERIQTINAEQNLFYRILKVVKLEIDTAGSKGKEAVIQALSLPVAETLKRFILHEKEKQDIAAEHTAVEPSDTEVRAGSRILFRLGALDLLKIGLSQDHGRAALILLAFIFSRFEDAQEILGEQMYDYIDQASGFGDVYLIAVLLLIVLFISFVISLLRTFFRYYDFTLEETSAGFRVFSGLLTRREKNMNTSKMQIFTYSSGPVRRLFGLHTIRIAQASSDELRTRDAVVIPGSYEPGLNLLMDRFFGKGYLPAELPHHIGHSIIYRNLFFAGFLPVLVLVPGIYWVTGVLYWSLPAVYLIYVGSRSYFYWRNFRFGFTEDSLVVRSGNWNRHHNCLSFYKVQSVEVKQNIVQQQRGLANLVLYTAAGEVSVPYVQQQQAEMLRDYILYRVESHTGTWM